VGGVEWNGGDSADAGEAVRAPSFQTVEVVLESWELHDAGLNVEPPLGDLELQIGWTLAYPVGETDEGRAVIAR
jgi:hypothetical protein